MRRTVFENMKDNDLIGDNINGSIKDMSENNTSVQLSVEEVK